MIREVGGKSLGSCILEARGVEGLRQKRNAQDSQVQSELGRQPDEVA